MFLSDDGVAHLQSQMETVSLVQTIREQVQGSNQPNHGKEEIDLLLDNVIVYLKRSKGISLEDNDYKIQPHKYLDGLVGVPSQRISDSLVRRLRVIQRFRIVSYEKIVRDLLTGVFDRAVEPVSLKENRLLSLIYENPQASTLNWSQELGVTQPTIRKMLTNLQERIGLRFSHFIDWWQFKLRRYAVFFETRNVEASRRLESVLREEMTSYLTTAIFDNTFQRGFIGFIVPDQKKPLTLLHEQISALEEAFLERVQVHDSTGSYSSISFDHFDFQTGDWIIESGITTVGLLNFLRDNREVLPNPKGIENTCYHEFDQLDYALANILTGEGRVRMKKIQKRLSNLGMEIPRTTVSTRKSQLLQNKAIVPYMVFDSPMLPVFLTFAIECTQEISDQLLFASAQMPATYAYPSKIGCSLFIKVPTKSLGSILYLLSLIGEEEGVSNILQIQQYKNLGSKSPLDLLPKWNGSYWEWDESEFTIPSLGLEF